MEQAVHMAMGIQPAEYSHITCICQVLDIKTTVLSSAYYHHKDARTEIELAIGGPFYSSLRAYYGIFVFNDTNNSVSLSIAYGSSH